MRCLVFTEVSEQTAFILHQLSLCVSPSPKSGFVEAFATGFYTRHLGQVASPCHSSSTNVSPENAVCEQSPPTWVGLTELPIDPCRTQAHIVLPPTRGCNQKNVDGWRFFFSASLSCSAYGKRIAERSEGASIRLTRLGPCCNLLLHGNDYENEATGSE